MKKDGKEHILIPALITVAATYFGFKKKSEKIGSIAQELVHQAIEDQTKKNQKLKDKRRKSKRKQLTLPYK